jgi:hypothetical protein
MDEKTKNKYKIEIKDNKKWHEDDINAHNHADSLRELILKLDYDNQKPANN